MSLPYMNNVFYVYSNLGNTVI